MAIEKAFIFFIQMLAYLTIFALGFAIIVAIFGEILAYIVACLYLLLHAISKLFIKGLKKISYLFKPEVEFR